MSCFKEERRAGFSLKKPSALEFIVTGCTDIVLLEKSGLLGSGKIMEEKSFKSFSYTDTVNHSGTAQEQVLEDLRDIAKHFFYPLLELSRPSLLET